MPIGDDDIPILAAVINILTHIPTRINVEVIQDEEKIITLATDQDVVPGVTNQGVVKVRAGDVLDSDKGIAVRMTAAIRVGIKININGCI